MVDDDPLILRALRTRLQHAGHEVSAHADGASALSAAERWPADVALIDINMPGLNGINVAKGLRRLRPECAVILQTAGKSEDVLREARQSDVLSVLEKPFEARELLELVESSCPKLVGVP
jgi:DNA-binding NtrC family response regulator